MTDIALKLRAENKRLRMALALLVACDDELQAFCTGENGCPLEAHHHAVDTAKAALRAPTPPHAAETRKTTS